MVLSVRTSIKRIPGTWYTGIQRYRVVFTAVNNIRSTTPHLAHPCRYSQHTPRKGVTWSGDQHACMYVCRYTSKYKQHVCRYVIKVSVVHYYYNNRKDDDPRADAVWMITLTHLLKVTRTNRRHVATPGSYAGVPGGLIGGPLAC